MTTTLAATRPTSAATERATAFVAEMLPAAIGLGRSLADDTGEQPRKGLTSGLALVAAFPETDDRGRVIGARYGGLLLNGRTEIVDRVRLLVYGSDVYDGRPLGSSNRGRP